VTGTESYENWMSAEIS